MCQCCFGCFRVDLSVECFLARCLEDMVVCQLGGILTWSDCIRVIVCCELFDSECFFDDARYSVH